MAGKKTLVIGASTNPGRYASLAVSRLTEKGYDVIPLGLHEGTIHGKTILTGKPELKDIHTVTLYIRPEIQKSLYSYILSLHPQRIIFNPGTENEELAGLARKEGIETTEACTLVMLSIGIF